MINVSLLFDNDFLDGPYLLYEKLAIGLLALVSHYKKINLETNELH